MQLYNPARRRQRFSSRLNLSHVSHPAKKPQKVFEDGRQNFKGGEATCREDQSDVLLRHVSHTKHLPKPAWSKVEQLLFNLKKGFSAVFDVIIVASMLILLATATVYNVL